MLTLQAILMDLLVFCLGLILLLAKLVTKKDAKVPYNEITIVGLVIVGLAGWFNKPPVPVVFSGMYYTDNYSLFFKELIVVCAILICLASREFVDRKGLNEPEYYMLVSFATLGMMNFTAAGDLVTLFVGIELMTMSFIVLIGFDRHNALATEAGLKYLVLSALSSAVMLYGIDRKSVV